MMTIAVAARTMDRHARYRSLLPIRDFALLSALECATLARLIKTRPVDAIIFDLQKPTMPAEEWLDLLARDPELNSVMTIWVGRDVPPNLLERISTLEFSLAVPSRPDSQTLVQALEQAAAHAASTRKKPGDTHPRGIPDWRPGEDIIDQALSIFDQPAGKEESAPAVQRDDWQVSELACPPGAAGEGTPTGGREPHQVESAALTPEPEPPIALNVEEIGTGSFAITLEPPRPQTNRGLVNEKILAIHQGTKDANSTDAQLVDRITGEVVAELTYRLADELVSRIDPQMIRSIIEEKLYGSRAREPLNL